MNTSTKPVAKNLGFKLMRATEAAALVASRWVGRGAITKADQAAARALRDSLAQTNISGHIVVGERPENVDPALLGEGVSIGTGLGSQVDLVIDSIEGVRLLAEGLPDAISVVAAAPQGSMMERLPVSYLEKLVVNAAAAKYISPECFDAPPAWTLGIISSALHKTVRDLTVFVLNRPRHEQLIEDLRTTGARVILRPQGDVVGAVLAATPHSGIDLMIGTGGIQEGIMATCAVKALGGVILCRPCPENEIEERTLQEAGFVEGEVLHGDDLVRDDNVYFAATGITDGLLLRGVRHHENGGATTHSLVLNGRSRIRREITAEHHKEIITRLN